MTVALVGPNCCSAWLRGSAALPKYGAARHPYLLVCRKHNPGNFDGPWLILFVKHPGFWHKDSQ